jgi:hypothetical protein
LIYRNKAPEFSRWPSVIDPPIVTPIGGETTGAGGSEHGQTEALEGYLGRNQSNTSSQARAVDSEAKCRYRALHIEWRQFDLERL